MTKTTRFFLIILSVFILSSCAAGNAAFNADNPAGFWYGLWHGVISVIALLIHLFNENVGVYEINNTGGWYDFGFLLGIIIVWGGGCHASCKSAKEKEREKEWDEIGEKVEQKIMRKLKHWAEDEHGDDTFKEWEEIGAKVEQKLKRKIREWAEKE
ncbi:MAG: hypothetical protein QNJ56_09040 [Gammaproteobacteria bacterium]|nr:hypothetical protein [Gammaproteobacteria bacterium]